MNKLPLSVPVLLTAVVVLARSVPGQPPLRLEGPKVAVTPEFESERRPIYFTGEPPAGMYWSGGATTVTCLAYAPDDKTLAVGDGPTSPRCTFLGSPPVNENGGLIRLIDMSTNRVSKVLGAAKLPAHEYAVSQLVFTPDSATLVALGKVTDRRGDHQLEARSLTVWDVARGQVRWGMKESPENRWVGTAISPRGDLLALALQDGTISLWNAVSGRRLRWLECFNRPLREDAWRVALVFSADGGQVAAGDEDGNIRLWEVATGNALGLWRGHELVGQPFGVRSLLFSPDGRLLLADTSLLRRNGEKNWEKFSEAILIDVIQRRERATLRHPRDEIVFSVAFSADGKTVVTGSHLGLVRLWDTDTGNQRAVYGKDKSWILSLAFAPDGRTLAAGDRRSIALWDLASGKLAAELLGPQEDVWHMAFAPDGRTLAAAGGVLRLWDMRVARDR